MRRILGVSFGIRAVKGACHAGGYRPFHLELWALVLLSLRFS